MSRDQRRTAMTEGDAVAGSPLRGRASRRAVLGTSLAIGAAGIVPVSLGTGGKSAQANALQESTGGEIIINLNEPDSLFSGAIESAVGGNMMRFIANGLTKLSQPTMDAAPDLAAGWQVSADGKTYTFTLNAGVLWQDGQPFSAADVLFSYGLWAHPNWPGPLDPNLAVIVGATEYKAGQAETISGIVAVDETTVTFTLTDAVASFLATVTTSQILPQHILKDVPPADAAKDPFAQKPVYTGPFMVEEWRPGDGITFRAFPDCFAGRPKLDTIITRTIPDPATAIADLQTGGLNLAFVAPDQYESFKADSAYQTQELAGVAGWFLTFDENLPLFSDPRVRQAMSHAIDRQTIIDTIFLGRAEANHGIASPLSWTYNPTIPKFDFDLDKANALLDEAGWPMGSNGLRAKDGQEFSFKLNVSPRTRDWAVAVQPFLETAGIHYDVNELEFGTWIEQLAVGKHQASFSGWFNFIVDPRADLQNHFESPRASDMTGYNNPDVNQLFQQARTALDRETEKGFYDKIQEIAEGDAVNVYLWRLQDLLVLGGDFTLPVVQTQSELYARAAEWSTRA